MTDHPGAPDGAPITHCQRCGSCCCKGGPTLHQEDRELVDSGRIALADLFTIRQGEPALDNINNTIAPAVTDIIMMKGLADNRPHCRHYDYATRGCRIYESRPRECRALECWNTAEIERIYTLRRLTRRHLFSKVDGLWSLIQDHQEHCDYGYIAELADRVKRLYADAAPAEALLSLVHYDEGLRQATVRRTGMDPDILPLLFGRPLSFTIQLFRLKYVNRGGRAAIEPLGPTHEKVCYRRQ